MRWPSCSRDFPGCLNIDRQSVWLDPSKVSVDLAEAQTALNNGDFEKAASLFRRGEFLDKAVAKDAGFSDWLLVERTRWSDLARKAVLQRAEDLLKDDSPVAAEEMTLWLLRRDPLDEAAVLLAMRAKAATGSVSGAMRLYKEFESAFARELGVAPAPETVAAFEGLAKSNGPTIRLVPADPSEPDHRPRVVVMPFTDIHAGPDGSTMADSLTEEVIDALGRFSELAVTGRETSFSYRNVSRDMPALVRDLDIQYVVSGTVRRLGERLRIRVELDDAIAQQFVSSEKRDCLIEDFYDVHEDLARAIAGAIEPELISDTTRKFARRPVASLALWEKALVARGHLARGSKEGIFASEALSLNILQEDPDQFMTLKVLATARYAKIWNFWVDDILDMAAASLSISERILEQDPFDADALSIAARHHLTLLDFDRALQLAEQAVDMNPSNAQSHIHLGASYSSLGRYHEALDHFHEARRISPRDRNASYWDCAESYARFGLGQFEDVARIAGASARKPGTWAWTRFILAVALVRLQRLDEAREQIRHVRQDNPTLTFERIRPLLKPKFDEEFADSLQIAGLPDH